jgi:hypothetical protein
MVTIEWRNAGARRRYDKNREAHNALRRENYAHNKEARDKARARAARYRSESHVIDRTLTREVNGKTVEVFSTGQVAEFIGRTPQMLRNWENANMIPPSSFGDKHRLYTKSQVRMLVSLENIIAINKGSWSHPKVKAKVRTIAKRW